MVAVLVTVLATLATAVLSQTMDPCPPCDQVALVSYDLSWAQIIE